MIVIIAGIVIAAVINQDSGENEKTGVNSEIGKDEGDAQENDDEKDEPYNGTGLEIMDEVDGTVDSVDGSGNWENPSNQTDNTQSNDTNKEDSNIKNDDDEEDADEDILIDDKIWGEPS